MIRVAVSSLESYRIAVQARRGRLNFFLDGRHVLSQPFRPSEPIAAFSLLFNRKFETSKPYPDAPALVTDFRIAAYSEKTKGPTP